jgi:hypothetical protein
VLVGSGRSHLTGTSASPTVKSSSRSSFLREHSLSVVLGVLLAVLFILYRASEPETRAGALYGNAFADWLGVLAFVIATKYFFETGSAESRTPARRVHRRVSRFLVEHSLTIVLTITGIAWAVAFARSEVGGRSGELLGNIVSDWTQVLGLVLLTKYTRERGSKEGR